jgi:ABC-type transport system involved in multi-copper enzyme maturation permease subunit
MSTAPLATAVAHRQVERKAGPWVRAAQATWLQHRAVLRAIGIGFLVMLVVSLWFGQQHEASYWLLDWGTQPAEMLYALAVLIGMFLGAPLISREIEAGTFRFAWAQEMGGRRLLARKMVLLMGGLATVAFLLALAATRYFTALQPFGSGRWTPLEFNLTVLTYPAWTLLAFALGAFVGVLIRRTIAAIAATAAALSVLVIFASSSIPSSSDQPAAHYWLSQGLEALTLLAVAVWLAAGAVLFAGRRS